jgi:hypothetical protein
MAEAAIFRYDPGSRSRKQDPMPWLARVATARTPDDVLAIAREYVSHFAVESGDSLPAELRPGSLATADELQQYALSLARYHGHGERARAVYKVSEFFSRAAVRLAELATPAPGPRRNPLDG